MARPRKKDAAAPAGNAKQNHAAYGAVVATGRHVAHALGNLLAGLSLSLELLEGTALDAAQRRYLERCLRLSRRLNAFQQTLAMLGGGGRGAPAKLCTKDLLRATCATLRLPDAQTEVMVAPGAERLFGQAALLHEALAALATLLAAELGDAGTLRLQAEPQAAGVAVRMQARGGAARGPLWTDAGEVCADAPAGAAAALLLVATVVEHLHGGGLVLSLPPGEGPVAQLSLPTRGPGA